MSFLNTARKVSKYGAFSYLNTVKYGPEKAPYLDTFLAVERMKNIATVNEFKNKLRNRTHSIITFTFMETVVYQNAY